MSDITTLLHAAAQGDGRAAEQAVTLLYRELHQLAHSRLRRSGGQAVLDTTALVHEGWLRLQRSGLRDFPDRKHFLSYAARAMRSVVVDLVRAQQARRRGGEVEHLTLSTALGEVLSDRDDDILRVHEALDDLAAAEPRLAQVVEMRWFAGLAEAEIADALGVTERTVQRDWRKARMYLAAALA